jgi:hypothetical protein
MSIQSSNIIINLKTRVMSHLYEMLDIKTIIKLTTLNSFFKKPLGLNKDCIITYLYLQKLMRLYTKECYCYLLSNQSFHKKLLIKFSKFSEDDILKGKILAFVNILEFYDYEIDFACLNFGQNVNLQIFYMIFKAMPMKYKEMACFKLTKILFFDTIFLENLEKIKCLEILLDNRPEKVTALGKFFDPVKFFIKIVELTLIHTADTTEDTLQIINHYFEAHNNCLQNLILEIKSEPVDLDLYTPIINFNKNSLKSFKIKGGFFNYENSNKFFNTLSVLHSLNNIMILFDNEDDNLENLMVNNLIKMHSIKNITCNLKFQVNKDFMFQIDYESVNYGEYFVEDTDLYNKQFFNYFIGNDNLLQFEFNFDNFNSNEKENLDFLANLSKSFERKRIRILKIRSHSSDEFYFLEFISSLKKLKYLKEIFFDIMCVSPEFLEALELVIIENKSIIKVFNDTWANMSIQIKPYFHFYFDSFSESILNILLHLEHRNHHINSYSSDHLNNGMKIIIKDVNLVVEEEIFNSQIWIKYPEIVSKINLLSIDFDNLPDYICENLKQLLFLTKNLKILSLEKCELSDSGWESIAEGISSLKNLNELKLFCTNVDDSCCIKLLQSIDCLNLFHLDFRGNEIGEETLKFILKNKTKFQNLIKLKFINNGFIESPDALDDFSDFLNNSKLIFSVELNKKIIMGELNEKYKELDEKFNYLFLPY